MSNTTKLNNDQANTLRSISSSEESFPEKDRERVTTVFSITSGKGGVGKTAVVSNIAICLAKKGKRVLILDADLGLANIDVVFGLTPTYNLNHFFSGKQPLKEVLVEGPHGIRILPAGSGIQNYTRLESHHKLKLIEGLDSLHNLFDYVLIDTEAGISENVTYFNTAAQEILVVTTPEPTAITDAYALMKLLSSQYHEKHFNLIVNRVSDEEEALDVYKKLSMVSNRYLDISIDYFGSVPDDRKMVESIRKQKVITELFPGSKTASAFAELANRLNNEQYTAEPKGNVQFFWNKILNLGPK